MKIKVTPAFKKAFKERILKRNLLEEYKTSLDIFLKDSKSDYINDHILHKDLKGFRAFSITDDVRVIYKKVEGGVLFIDVGKHDEVY